MIGGEANHVLTVSLSLAIDVQIGAQICSRDTKLPLLLSLGLKQQLDETRLRALLEHLENKRPWLKQA